MAAYDRLSAVDAGFLRLEGRATPMHVAGLLLFEGKPLLGPDGHVRIDDVRQKVGRRLHLVPRFRQRLMPVPLGLGRPVWVDDDGFDLAHHVRRTTLPPPGTEPQLLELMAAEQSVALDRRHPLWEMLFVSGLDGDRVALIYRVHHAVADGVSGVEVASVLLDLDPDPPEVETPTWAPRPPPSPSQLLADTLSEQAALAGGVLGSLGSAIRQPEAALATARNVSRALSSALGTLAPRTPLNVAVGPRRRYQVVRAGLADVKAAGAAMGGTVNDIVLAAVAGALGRFLAARGQPVGGLVLRALVPISLRPPTERATLGNRVWASVINLPVGVAEPRERVAAVAASMRAAKAAADTEAAGPLLELGRHAPPVLIELVARLLPHQRAVNAPVTNVPGPQFPLWCMGARLQEVFPYVGVFDGLAVSFAVVSYDGRLGFGLTADRGAVPDLDVLAEGLEKSIAQLTAAGG